MTYRIGYCTSGFQSHRLEDALQIIADMGYRGVFLTLDTCHLDPFAPDAAHRTGRIAELLRSLDLAVVVETGARYLLDPRRKHMPSLLSREGAERREQFLHRSLEIAADLGAACISTWSGGNPDGLDDQRCWRALVASFTRLVRAAEQLRVMIAFEPEPGMFVETVEGYHELKRRLGSPDAFGLSLDLGHLLVTGEGSPADMILREQEELFAVALEDMRRGVHEHLPFGEGDLDLSGTVQALNSISYDGVVAVELGRHSHEAVHQAARSRDILSTLGVTFGVQ